MELKHVIVHKIDRERNTPASYTERDTELDVDNELVIDLIDEILTAYARGKSYGSFNQDTDTYPAQGWLNAYLNSAGTTGDFVRLTKQLLRRIGSEMVKRVFAVGGYFVFAEYSNSQDYFLVAMVKDRSGLTFTPDLDISNVTEIDLNNLHQAAQVNIESFVAGQEGYLSFLRTKNQPREVLAYFTDALGCTDVIPSKISTHQALSVVEEVCNRANLDHAEIRNIRDVAYEYLHANVHNSVSLNMISAQINSLLAEQYHNLFVELANSDSYRISMEFQPNATALRKYRKFDIKAGRWSLNFEKNVLGSQESNSDIVWDGDVLTFRNVPERYRDELDSILRDNE